MTRRTAKIAAMLATLTALAVPAAASAAETVFVSDTKVLTYWSDAGQVDTVRVVDGTTGTHRITETTSPTGGPGQGCTGAGVCTGATSAWLQGFDLDDSLTVDAALPSSIDGGWGADTIAGSPLADTVIGNLGGDTLDGRGGVDAVYGGEGDDTVEARDGSADTIDCGSGTDTAHVDAEDRVSNCEVVTPPVVDEPPVEDPLEPGEELPLPKGEKDRPSIDVPELPEPVEELRRPSVGITQREAKVSADGVAQLTMACAPTEVDGCVGTIFVDPAPKGRADGKVKDKAHGKAKGKARALVARRGRFGKSPFRIAAGKQKRLSVKLSRSARSALGLNTGRRAAAARRGRRVKAVVTVSQRGKAPRRQKVTLRS